ncbi:MAG TPA: hypothetical protein PKA37_16750, partial [Planctomycetota bacterium]|nr:hypothetical protein [Planctomycetota bacterium]
QGMKDGSPPGTAGVSPASALTGRRPQNSPPIYRSHRVGSATADADKYKAADLELQQLADHLKKNRRKLSCSSSKHL